MSKVTVTIAWTEEDGLEATGRNVLRDANWFPEFKVVAQPRALVWVNKGTEADVAKAQAYAAKECPANAKVFTFPTNCKNALEQSKQKVMA